MPRPQRQHRRPEHGDEWGDGLVVPWLTAALWAYGPLGVRF